jgi:hypothetical protein
MADSDRPITDVGHKHRRMSPRDVRSTFDKWDLERFKVKPVYDVSHRTRLGPAATGRPPYPGAIMPGESAVQEFADAEKGSQYQHRWVHFRDSNGVRWVRDLADGDLMRAGGLRYRYRLRRGWLRQTLFVRAARESFKWWEYA